MSNCSLHYKVATESSGTDACLPTSADDLSGQPKSLYHEGTLTVTGDLAQLSPAKKKKKRTKERGVGRRRQSSRKDDAASPGTTADEDDGGSAGPKRSRRNRKNKKDKGKSDPGAGAGAGRSNPYQAFRQKNMEKFVTGRTVWEPRELASYRAARSADSIVGRVIVIRHGMGMHNDLKGIYSYKNRDALLNEIGEEQSRETGKALKAAGVFDALDLVVVSPFRRTIQTANGVFGEDMKAMKTVLQPLCAEHTFNWSSIQQGDRGSTPTELLAEFPTADYPQYNFDDIHAYCSDHGVTEPGAWWHHGKKSSETHRTFKARAVSFKTWLGQQMVLRQAKLVAVVSHGGFLSTAFGYPKLHNCEFRAFDMTADGRYLRVATAGTTDELLDQHVATFELYTVHLGPKVTRHRYYDLCGVMNHAPFSRRWKLSTLRTKLHGQIRKVLCGAEFIGVVGAATYSEDAELQSVIYTFPKSSIGAVEKLREWFEKLSIVIDRHYFPAELTKAIEDFLFVEVETEGSGSWNPVTNPFSPDFDPAAIADANASPGGPGHFEGNDDESDDPEDVVDDALLSDVESGGDDDDGVLDEEEGEEGEEEEEEDEDGDDGVDMLAAGDDGGDRDADDDDGNARGVGRRDLTPTPATAGALLSSPVAASTAGTNPFSDGQLASRVSPSISDDTDLE